METKFQTSFIPKKPTASTIGGFSTSAPKKVTASIFMTIATVLFILSIASAGGAYAYKQYLYNTQNTYKGQLATRENQFNINLIEQLKAENVKIDLSRQVLNNHIALSQVFDMISRITTENVRFMNLDISVPAINDTNNGQVKIALQGYGTSFSAVAFQSDVLNQLDQYGLRNVIKNPILSNPTQGTNNTISFGFSATVDPSSLSYEKLLSASPSGASLPTQSSTN